MQSSKTFALIDCNNFYASCEQVFDPTLNNKPIIVLSNNDGCIISRSQTAKDLDIKMTGPLFKNRNMIKKHQIAIRSSNYALYGDMSQRVMNSIEPFADNMEVYSIDEAFIDITSQPVPHQHCHTIRQTITRNTGIPVSIGIANTKTRAKIANEIAKKIPRYNGVCTLPDDIPDKFFQTIPVQDIWGIGYKQSLKLQGNNVNTAFDLMQKDDDWIRQKLSINGLRTVYELRGISCLPLEDSPPSRKNINVSRSFGHLVTEQKHLEEAISEYTTTAAEKLRKQNLITSFLYVYIRTNRFHKTPQHNQSAHCTLASPTDHTPTLIKHARQLIAKIYAPNFRYQKVGICLMGLLPNTHQQTDLFQQNPQNHPNLLIKKVDQLNQQYGRNTLFYGATGTKKTWKMKQEYRSPRYTTHWNELPTVNS